MELIYATFTKGGIVMFKRLNIEGAILYSPYVYYDNRGLFFEGFNELEFRKVGIKHRFLQDNISVSRKKYTIRGLHFQRGEHAQGKLVRCTRGELLDIIVDLRENSPTYLKYERVYLSEDNFDMVFVPRGCAHGFITLRDNTEVHYKVDKFYNKESEGILIYNDKIINIDWGIDLSKESITLSSKDLGGLPLDRIKLK